MPDERNSNGSLRARPRAVRPLPRRGGVKRYVVTSAQNNTDLHGECWRNLLALAKHDGAEVMVSRFTYATASRASRGQKKTAREAVDTDEWWSPAIAPYVVDESVELAPSLVFCGELQILPTAPIPLSGLESYTGRASSIVPHVTFAMQSVAGPKASGAKFLYTTGTVTLRNYIGKKAGQAASFHHGYGALIVEVCSDGVWFVRQLNADSEGVIYDLGRKVCAGKVSRGHRPEALVWGDIHTRQLEPEQREIGWGRNGILETLRPRRQVLHDVLDFRSQNHHDRNDPWKTYAKHVECGLSVADEIDELGAFLEHAARPWCETAIVVANHDEAMMRWLREADFREDPTNALFMLEATLATYRAIKGGDKAFYPVRWAVEHRCGKVRNARWLARDEEYIVCPDASGGIELGMHGDVGLNGARGNLPSYARTGRKTITGHTHSAGLRHGAMSVGVMGNLDMGYNRGMSSWSHSNALVYANGKRAIVTIRGKRWRA